MRSAKCELTYWSLHVVSISPNYIYLTTSFDSVDDFNDGLLFFLFLSTGLGNAILSWEVFRYSASSADSWEWCERGTGIRRKTRSAGTQGRACDG